MKKLVIGALMVSALVFAACNNAGNKEKHDMSQMENDSAKQESGDTDPRVVAIMPTFTDVDAKAAGYIKTVVDHYLHLKNALAGDNSNEAANAGKEMAESMNKVDKSFFTAEQKKAYDANEENLKEHAEHISQNSSNIEQQREHFSMMSEDVYALTKAFGGGQTLYRDYCPMYKDKGANWISETSDIKNPYLGSKMATCGEVKEKIK